MTNSFNERQIWLGATKRCICGRPYMFKGMCGNCAPPYIEEKVEITDRNVRFVLSSINRACKGYEAYIVGGSCRDAILGKTPKDYDICTNATPAQLKEIFPDAIEVSESFPVVLWRGIEIATFRKDRRDSAEVASTLEEDVVRRDFTINAVAYDKLFNRFIDHVGGVADIQNRILRFVGDPLRRIEEDPVRILRGVRFASLYNLSIEKETFFAMFQNRDLIKDIPAERIQLEVMKAFKSNNTHRFLTMLDEMEMLEYVFPSLMLLKGIDGGGYHKECVLSHCFNAVKAIDDCGNWELKLSALYHDVGKHSPELNDKGLNTFKEHCLKGLDLIVSDLKDHLKFPNKLVDYVKYLSAYHMGCLDHRKAFKKLYAKLLEKNIPLRDIILLRYADNKGNVLAHTDFRDTWKLYKQCLKILNEKQPFSVKDLAIDGGTLMAFFKIPQGKVIGDVLRKVFESVQEELVENDRKHIVRYILENEELRSLVVRECGNCKLFKSERNHSWAFGEDLIWEGFCMHDKPIKFCVNSFDYCRNNKYTEGVYEEPPENTGDCLY